MSVDSSELEMIKRYQESGCMDSINSLLRAYKPVIKAVSRGVIQKNKAYPQEIYSAAMRAFVDGVARYTDGRSLFSTYIRTMVRYGCQDCVRSIKPRDSLKKSKMLSNSFNKLSQTLERDPSLDEVLADSRIERGRMHTATTKLFLRQCSSLDALNDDSCAGSSNGIAVVLRNELMQELSISIDQLSDKRKAIVKMALLDGMSQKEIAKELGVTIGAVSSCMKSGILQLRGMESVISAAKEWREVNRKWI